jgi:hypothetical protein
MEIVADDLHLGHALGDKGAGVDGRAVGLALDIAIGTAKLEPRPPSDPVCVKRAETVLGAAPPPIYTFIGDLHPELGSVGVVFSRRWASRCLQGVSRCDTGGMAGLKGCFAELASESAATVALRAVSSPDGIPAAEWEGRFKEEIDSSYSEGALGYVRGDRPNVLTWSDARRKCIEAGVAGRYELDRRLWTWELRLNDAPKPDEVEALIFSSQAFTRVNEKRRRRPKIPDSVRLVFHDPVVYHRDHWFETPATWATLSGRESWPV